MRKLSATAVVLVSLLVACSRSPSEPGDSGSLPVTSVAKATISNRTTDALREVVRDGRQWQAVWSDLWGTAAPPLPAIDFDREMVIVAAAPFCFADVRVEGVLSSAGVVQVNMAESTQTSSCLCAAPETTFHAVRTTRVPGAARFTVRPIPPTCPS